MVRVPDAIDHRLVPTEADRRLQKLLCNKAIRRHPLTIDKFAGIL